MAIHHEIKQRMRWGFGTLLAIAGMVVAAIRFVP